MNKLKKKEIRATVESAMNQALSTLQIQEPSKKTKKILDKASRKVVTEMKRILNKKIRKDDRAAAKFARKNGKASPKAVRTAQKIEA